MSRLSAKVQTRSPFSLGLFTLQRGTHVASCSAKRKTRLCGSVTQFDGADSRRKQRIPDGLSSMQLQADTTEEDSDEQHRSRQ
jgi:hypothetical protein